MKNKKLRLKNSIQEDRLIFLHSTREPEGHGFYPWVNGPRFSPVVPAGPTGSREMPLVFARDSKPNKSLGICRGMSPLTSEDISLDPEVVRTPRSPGTSGLFSRGCQGLIYARGAPLLAGSNLEKSQIPLRIIRLVVFLAFFACLAYLKMRRFV